MGSILTSVNPYFKALRSSVVSGHNQRVSIGQIAGLSCAPRQEDMLDPLLKDLGVFKGDYRYSIVQGAIVLAARTSLFYLYADMKNLSSLNCFAGDQCANTLIQKTFGILTGAFEDAIWSRINGSGGDELCGVIACSEDVLQERLEDVTRSLAAFATTDLVSLVAVDEQQDSLQRLADLSGVTVPVTAPLSELPSLKRCGGPGFGLHLATTLIHPEDCPAAVFQRVSTRLEERKLGR